MRGTADQERARPSWRRRLLIFAKEPRPGWVKSRLGREIGSVAAAAWYRRQALSLARRMAADARWETWIAVSPDAEALSSRFWPRGLRRWPQGRGDLGARMGRAFRAFPPGPLAIIGADAPGVEHAHIAEAFAALGAAEAAIGPARDGGYWLIALRRGRRAAPPGLFDRVRWSTEHALADTLLGLGRERAALITTLADVDHAADLPPKDRARWS
ncbi:MAG: DUF2064 domain-containing protein [Pseudomonadota bacterium]